MKKINKHIPVLLNETINNLNLKDDGVYVDATLGMGGYTRKILDNSNCTLIGIDRDPFAIKEALPLIKKYGVRLKLINGLFSNIDAPYGSTTSIWMDLKWNIDTPRGRP